VGLCQTPKTGLFLGTAKGELLNVRIAVGDLLYPKAESDLPISKLKALSAHGGYSEHQTSCVLSQRAICKLNGERRFTVASQSVDCYALVCASEDFVRDPGG
jgi:hypothetical protein